MEMLYCCNKMIVIFLSSVLSLCVCQAPEPKYVLNFDSPLYTVGEISKENVDTSGVSCERYNESVAYMDGELVFLKDMDNLCCEIILHKEASGKHEVVFSHDICDLCAEMGDEGSDYKPYMENMGLPTSCPIKAGKVIFKQVVVNTDSFEMKDQHCGPYIADVIMFKKTGENCKNDREMIFHMKMDMRVERQD